MKIKYSLFICIFIFIGCEAYKPVNIKESDQAYVIQKNTPLVLELQTPLSSNDNVRGDIFYADLKKPIVWEGKIILSQDVKVGGIVKQTTKYEKLGDRASLLLFFDQMILPNNKVIPIVSTLDTSLSGNAIKIKGKAEEDAKAIFDYSIGSSFLGGMGPQGTRSGIAGAGPAFGSVAVLISDMQEIRLTVGTEITLILQENLLLPKEAN